MALNRLRHCDDTPAKSLIFLATQTTRSCDAIPCNPLISLRATCDAKIPHTPYALALAWRSRRALAESRIDEVAS